MSQHCWDNRFTAVVTAANTNTHLLKRPDQEAQIVIVNIMPPPTNLLLTFMAPRHSNMLSTALKPAQSIWTKLTLLLLLLPPLLLLLLSPNLVSSAAQQQLPAPNSSLAIRLSSARAASGPYCGPGTAGLAYQ